MYFWPKFIFLVKNLILAKIWIFCQNFDFSDTKKKIEDEISKPCNLVTKYSIFSDCNCNFTIDWKRKGGNRRRWCSWSSCHYCKCSSRAQRQKVRIYFECANLISNNACTQIPIFPNLLVLKNNFVFSIWNLDFEHLWQCQNKFNVAPFVTLHFRVCTVLCGGNIDASTLTRVVDRGLIAEGRICRFTVIVADRPGGMAEMLQIIADVSYFTLNKLFSNGRNFCTKLKKKLNNWQNCFFNWSWNSEIKQLRFWNSSNWYPYNNEFSKPI